jgi:hypothetical protein
MFSAGVLTPVGSTARVEGTITNNTDDNLVFNTLVQFLSGGVDVVPPISGPSVTVTAGTTTPPFVVANLPTLPDGYFRVLITGLGTAVGSTAEYESASQDYLKVIGGVPSVIGLVEWSENSEFGVAR